MKKIFLFSILIFSAGALFAQTQTTETPVYKAAPGIELNSDGTVKGAEVVKQVAPTPLPTPAAKINNTRASLTTPPAGTPMQVKGTLNSPTQPSAPVTPAKKEVPTEAPKEAATKLPE